MNHTYLVYISASGANATATQANAGAQMNSVQNNRAQPAQPQAAGPFAGRGVAIGGTDPNNRGQESTGILGRKNNYNQVKIFDNLYLVC